MTEADIRLARQNDLQGVLELYTHLNPEDPKIDPAVAESAWSALLTSGLTRVFVADVSSKLASTCTLIVVPNLTRGGRSYAIIENVVTHPDYRNAGLGRAVLATALSAAWEADCYKVMLATGSKLESTLRFYEGAGFERGGKTFFQARRP
jgi:GNAT superfamily N-acetyltransferase